MLRKGQWLTAAALAVALVAQPASAANQAQTGPRSGLAALRIAWETLVSVWSAKLFVSVPSDCLPGQEEGAGCIDPGDTTSTGGGTPPTQCGPGQTESSSCQDPNG